MTTIATTRLQITCIATGLARVNGVDYCRRPVVELGFVPNRRTGELQAA